MYVVIECTLCDTVCQWLATGRRLTPGTPVYSTNKTERYEITEILSKAALNPITLTSETDFNDHYFYTRDIINVYIP